MPILLDENWQPFVLISDSELCDLMSFDTGLFGNYSIDRLDSMKFSQFSATTNNPLEHSDPDTNYFINDNNHISSNANCNQCKYYFSDTLNRTNFTNDMLSICSLNINSMSKNFLSFNELFHDDSKPEFDIIGICESKLSKDIETLFTLSGYSMFALSNKRNSGGLILYVNSKFDNVIVRDDLSKITYDAEFMVIELKVGNFQVVISMTYHRPGSNKVVFLNELENLVTTVSSENKKFYLTGDLNINLLDSCINNYVRQLIEIMHGNNMCNII